MNTSPRQWLRGLGSDADGRLTFRLDEHQKKTLLIKRDWLVIVGNEKAHPNPPEVFGRAFPILRPTAFRLERFAAIVIDVCGDTACWMWWWVKSLIGVHGRLLITFWASRLRESGSHWLSRTKAGAVDHGIEYDPHGAASRATKGRWGGKQNDLAATESFTGDPGRIGQPLRSLRPD